MALSPDRLREIVAELASRPHHEKVRTLVYSLLVDGLDASSSEVNFERPVPEVRGRIDALLGRTIFEFKSDLRREQRDAEARLPDYLSQRQRETSAHFVAVATDGATFHAYELRAAKLTPLDTFSTRIEKPHAVLEWLSSVVSLSEDLKPDADVVRRELGRGSLAWAVAKQELTALWMEVSQHPDVRLKRGIWDQLIRRVYGSSLNEDILFLQHTYLTIIAKTMAAKVLNLRAEDPDYLLSGSSFREAGIAGAVESDFFDWLLAAENGPDLVRRVARQAGRFQLENVETDVLKGLYESLIDPEQRHFLGEYYTPDWLAERVCAEAITRPLEQRVLDPACGSGTFVFHAVRRLLNAGEEAGVPTREAIERACRQVFGVDVHPVSAQIARVTFLLAIGPDRLKQRPPTLNIPIYMGDSLQWNTEGFMAKRNVRIEVPGSDLRLDFPFEITQDPSLFDAVIAEMLQASGQSVAPEGFVAWLRRWPGVGEDAMTVLALTYARLRELARSGRDHIWGFVARNLVRPIWLSDPPQKVDVVVGNPPWLSYRFMDAEMQNRFRAECQELGIWTGQVAQQQDLSAYFFVRSACLYLKDGGTIAFVMPYAAMTRRQFARFRTGLYGARQNGRPGLIYATLQFTNAWVLGDNVQPLFPVPSCVLFAKYGDGDGPRLPATVLAASGILPERDASKDEAAAALTWREIPWPAERRERVTEGYAARFRDGAVVFPTVLLRVELAPVGKLGSNPDAPVVQSRRARLEKPPWKDVPPLRGNVEREFLYPLYLGESVAPYRILSHILAVVPWDPLHGVMLESDEAQNKGYLHLGSWLTQAEHIWSQYSKGKRTLKEQCDYFGQLSAQFPIVRLRVAYSASGTLPAAALLGDPPGIIEHALYWAAVDSEEEGRYLTAVLNSEAARQRAEHLQSRGQWGARHFDKVMLSLPIPRFERSNKLHQRLAKAAAHADKVAAAVPLTEGMHFVTARQKIREALQEDGIAAEIDKLVAQLLDGP
ncbi:MAG: N-6 DNA methylase [Chloroflexi bacterium]|nr:N-6 DNA methylase [Chloroflexota bacterium]